MKKAKQEYIPSPLNTVETATDIIPDQEEYEASLLRRALTNRMFCMSAIFVSLKEMGFDVDPRACFFVKNEDDSTLYKKSFIAENLVPEYRELEKMKVRQLAKLMISSLKIIANLSDKRMKSVFVEEDQLDKNGPDNNSILSAFLYAKVNEEPLISFAEKNDPELFEMMQNSYQKFFQSKVQVLSADPLDCKSINLGASATK